MHISMATRNEIQQQQHSMYILADNLSTTQENYERF